jgi:cyclopropane fatty-acyl-phospholipid synthase-like methyltransferase
MSWTRERLKWWLFPGLNLHARQRYRILPRYFAHRDDGRGRVLDTGCGNGMLAYQSFRRGNRVLGVSIKEGEIERNRRLFNGYLAIDPERLSFRVLNLHQLDQLGSVFDEIICTEVLEHIADDRRVLGLFHASLDRGGLLHLCCPNADHPHHQSHALDHDETGGHVRTGYTYAGLEELLEPLGFEVGAKAPLGGPLRQHLNRTLTSVQQRIGLVPAICLFFLAAPLAQLDTRAPRVPYSIYLRATKK